MTHVRRENKRDHLKPRKTEGRSVIAWCAGCEPPSPSLRAALYLRGAQTVWMGAGQRLRGWGREGGGALSRQAVDATERLWGDNAWGADPAGPGQHAARGGGVGWESCGRGDLSVFAAAPVTAEQAWICHDCCLRAWSLRLCEISIAVIAPSTSCLLASTSSAEPAKSW